MTMKHFFLFATFSVLLLSYCNSVGAQSVKEVWSDMPDSVMPLLTRNNRLDCIDYWEAGQQGDVKNRLDGAVSIHYMSEDSLCVSDTPSSRYEMSLRRDKAGAVSAIVVRRVVTGTMTDWTERTYSPSWHIIAEKAAPTAAFEEQLLKGVRMM